MTTEIKTVSLLDQLRASRAIYEKALENLENLSDSALSRILDLTGRASTVDRVLGIASDDTVDRITFVKALQVPVVPDLDKRVAEAAEAGNLDMSTWHCGTTHCRAGWAVVFGGEAGAKLEKELGSEMAGRLIYEASTGRPAPDFFAGQDSALEDIRRCAAEAQ